MREFLDLILVFIGATSLTDGEFASLTITSAGLNAETYSALLAILNSREQVSTLRTRLFHYFMAKGVAVDEPNPARTNVLIGGGLS